LERKDHGPGTAHQSASAKLRILQDGIQESSPELLLPRFIFAPKIFRPSLKGYQDSIGEVDLHALLILNPSNLIHGQKIS
jgi:hypothetical protein